MQDENKAIYLVFGTKEEKEECIAYGVNSLIDKAKMKKII